MADQPKDTTRDLIAGAEILLQDTQGAKRDPKAAPGSKTGAKDDAARLVAEAEALVGKKGGHMPPPPSTLSLIQDAQKLVTREKPRGRKPGLTLWLAVGGAVVVLLGCVVWLLLTRP